MINNFLGDILIQCGQALQRTGARALGQNIALPPTYQNFSLLRPVVCPGSEIHQSALLTGNIFLSPDSAVGNNTIIHSFNQISEAEIKAKRFEDKPPSIELCFNAKIGSNCVLSTFDIEVPSAQQEENGHLARRMIIGEKAKIGNNCNLGCCIVEKEAIIKDDCVIGDDCLIEKGAVLEAGSVLPSGYRIPSMEIWAGNPAAFVDQVHEDH